MVWREDIQGADEIQTLAATEIGHILKLYRKICSTNFILIFPPKYNINFN
jgi:hypothetical protein